MVDDPKRGGYVPVCDEIARRARPACTCRVMSRASRRRSSATIEGPYLGCRIAEYLGYTDAADADESEDKLEASLDTLRQGNVCAQEPRQKIEVTEEGCPVSQHLLRHGYLPRRAR